jgi:thiamine-monophosphate kinase
MSRHTLTEREAIALLERLFGRAPMSRRIAVAIGDDAAVLRSGRSSLLWTIDVSVENVHFKRGWLGFADVGYRAFQAALSDLAAMGARPLGALSSLVVSADVGRRELLALGRGQAEAAAELGCPIIGGNISRGSEISVTTAALGEAKRPVLRRGARPGDELWLVGDVGLARAGMLLLSKATARHRRLRAYEARAPTGRRDAGHICIQHWRRPRALISEGARLVGRATAIIDVSDGLAGDASRLADASEVRVLVDEVRLRSALQPELIAVCSALKIDPLDVALEGGEDYALLACGPSRRRPRSARCIGSVLSGSGAFLKREADRRLRRLGAGFDHLA